jgi:steroid 5-alpha reductase family enzyme
MNWISFFQEFFTLLGICLAVFFLLWLLVPNPAWVDFVWTIMLGASAFYWWSHLETATVRSSILLALTCGWSSRLALHLFTRIRLHRTDPRYEELRQIHGPRARSYFLKIYLFQAFLVVVLSLSFFSSQSASSEFLITDGVGLVLFLVSILGESWSDRVLTAFKLANRSDPLALCKEGPWGWCRHPNYFFEWLHWIAYLAFSFGFGLHPVLGVLLFNILLMYWLLTRITGIPITERLMLKKRGNVYREYQHSTPAFFPAIRSRRN